jgi:pyruvate/2-oxoglutarate dehydrogenase complex dihydrolipoamide dehydrogenase (E3) component
MTRTDDRPEGMPVTDTVDAIVVGLGVAGEDVAGRLGEAGLEVLGIENRLVGGECPYWGCVPSKMLVRAASLLAEGRRIPGMAGESVVRPDYTPVARRIRDEATDNWNDQVAVDRLTGKGARFLRATAKVTGDREVTVDGAVFTARRCVVVATGTAPVIPPIEGLAGTPFWTNREALEATEAPQSLIVLGGGAIGVELAQGFARFGSDVTIVEAGERLLAVEEPEAGALLADILPREGLHVRTGVSATAVRYDGNGFEVTVADEVLRAQRLLVATGRRADLAGLGLDTMGVDITRRWVDVDDELRAGPGLWAVGDITGKGVFTHVATYQAPLAVASILGRPAPAADYHALPRVTFTDPEIGAVGLTEQQARAAGVAVRVGSSQVPTSTRGWIHKAGNDGFIKLVEDVDAGVLVGATSAGPVGGEVLGALAVAVHARVATESLAQMIWAYPTFHRAIGDAIADLRSR